MKSIFLIAVILFSVRSAGQNISVYEPEKVKYKTNKPDSSRVPLTETEVNFLFQALSFTDSLSAARTAHQFWIAMTDPAQFDGRYKTPVWWSGQDEKPVLALWSTSPDERIFTKGLFVLRYFGSYYGFNRPDTSDLQINDQLRNLVPLSATDPSLLKYGNNFKGTVKQRLEQLQAQLQPKGLSFFFFAKGAYYHDQLTAMVVRDKDIPALQQIFKKAGMTTLTWKECMQAKDRH